jgi:hypothetical protein
MRPATIRMSVVVALLIGFVTVLALAAAQGSTLFGAAPFANLVALVAIAVLLSFGLTAWDGEDGNVPNAFASGGRTFACVLGGAALGAMAVDEGAAVAGSCLALAVPVGLLSVSLDRRAWLVN